MPIQQQLPVAIYEQEVPPIVSTLLLPTRYKQGLVLNLGHSPLYRHFCKCLYIEMLKFSLVY